MLMPWRAASPARSSSTARAPRRAVTRHGGTRFDDVEDSQFLVEEDDVDRESHEGRVDRVGGAQQQPLARVEPAAAEQPPQACPIRVGDNHVHAV